MASKIEQIIDEIEECIGRCKSQPLSNGTRIIVNREEIEELLAELRSKTPAEIKNYQKMLSNKEAILADANARADKIVAAAQVQTSELINEHQIMQQAYAQANEVVMIATGQAQEILDHATNDANDIRMSAIKYTDQMLHSMEEILTNSIHSSRVKTDELCSSLGEYLAVISENRSQLLPSTLEDTKEMDVEEVGIYDEFEASKQPD